MHEVAVQIGVASLVCWRSILSSAGILELHLPMFFGLWKEHGTQDLGGAAHSLQLNVQK